MKKGGYMRKNKHRFFVISALAIIVFALPPLVGLAFGDTPATKTASYGFISIDIPNSSEELGFTTLADINDEGGITGGFTNSSGPGFLIDRQFRSIDIQCPATTSRELPAQPQSINRRGEITGFCSSGGRLHGFFRNSKGKYTLLDFPGAILTEASGINDDGQVVGDYRDSGGIFHGFFWDAGLFLTFDVPFPEATFTAPNAINNVGQIVGFYNDNNATPGNENGHSHGFLYDNGSFSSIDFPGAVITSLTDINDHGRIVGVYVENENDVVFHSFVLEDGRFSTFEVPFPESVLTEVNGINNRGQIVGRYVVSNPGDPVNPFLSHGFIATPESEPKSKSRVLVSKPNDFSNFSRWLHDVDEPSKGLGKWARRLK
jgi:hypothetical protein